MDQDQIKQLIRSEIQMSDTTSQFGVAKIPYHTHNGTDSPFISFDASGLMSIQVYDPAGIGEQVVGTTAAQTISSKTINSSILNKPTINASVQGVSALTGTTPTIDCSVANIFTITLSGNTTFSISNATSGQVFMVEAQQGSGTSYTNTWFSGITWVTVGAGAPSQTGVSSGYTTYGFRCTASNTYLGYLIGTN